ncbi:insulin-degrading enzyme-like, partial [Pogonomyrmex barbatus]|uniref:Insulin-degrading enzyme-like n=1 Tax=Pogonomyrmex barbatus TaxID=144034 RepID=A0A6I9WLJ5_9HYME
YMCDPDDLPGLAHFCEHMLFLGTKKYPQENNLRMYLSQNSGERNGETGADHTSYYFDVSSKKLEGALDRFAQFFLAPLFTENSIKCEVNVINLEYEVNMTNDGSRLEQFNRSSARSNHPFSKFNVGNRETLDIIPNQKGINVRDRLLEFYGKYYSANLMTLCVLGKESLDELENMIVNLFSEVPNKETEKPVWLEQPFEDEHFRTVWYIFPLQNIRYLKMLFPLPVIPNLQQLYPSS